MPKSTPRKANRSSVGRVEEPYFDIATASNDYSNDYSKKKLYTENDLDRATAEVHQALTSNPNLQTQLHRAEQEEDRCIREVSQARDRLTYAEVNLNENRRVRQELAEQLRREAIIAQSR